MVFNPFEGRDINKNSILSTFSAVLGQKHLTFFPDALYLQGLLNMLLI